MLEAVTDTAVKAFRGYENTLNQSVEEMVEETQEAVRETRESHRKIKDAYDRFFYMRGIREWIFWAGMICSAVNLILLVICITKIIT